jgi:hypothetical protein
VQVAAVSGSFDPSSTARQVVVQQVSLKTRRGDARLLFIIANTSLGQMTISAANILEVSLDDPRRAYTSYNSPTCI